MTAPRCSVCGAELLGRGPARRCPLGHADPLEAYTVAMDGAADTGAQGPTVTQEAPGPLDGAPTRVVADPLLPDVIDGLRIEYVAGSGGMATVYRAKDERLGTAVAVKVMKRSALGDPRALDRALREATAAARVQHPGIATVLRSGQLPDGRPWLATPFLEGRSLAALAEQHDSLPWQLVVPVLDGLASVLGAAHAVGVVHRDVKPANVFCVKNTDGSVTVKLLDFGLALLGEAGAPVPQTSAHSVAGTADFVAPEQALGRALDARADLYALGITAFQLLSGAVPFSDLTGTAVMRRHVFDDAPRLRGLGVDLPRRLDALVHRLLAKHPDDRPASTDEVRAALDPLRFAPPPGDGLLEVLARGWARAHPPSLGARLKAWWPLRTW